MVKKATDLDDDLDLKFMSLWGLHLMPSMHKIHALFKISKPFRDFMHKVCQADVEHKIYNIIWDKFSQLIRLFETHVFQPFWIIRTKNTIWLGKKTLKLSGKE